MTVQLYPWALKNEKTGREELAANLAEHVELFNKEEGWPPPPDDSAMSGVGQTAGGPVFTAEDRPEGLFTQEEVDNMVADAITDALLKDRQTITAAFDEKLSAEVQKVRAEEQAKTAAAVEAAVKDALEKQAAAAKSEAKASAKGKG